VRAHGFALAGDRVTPRPSSLLRIAIGAPPYFYLATVDVWAEDRERGIDMNDVESTETRQRVERWMEEGQYLLGRIIPGLLEKYDHLRAKADAAEQASERLRAETTQLQEQINALNHENQVLRKEQAEIREVFGKVREQMSQMLQPISDVVQRLQTTARMSG
jgi:chromosome segregation ATPase